MCQGYGPTVKLLDLLSIEIYACVYHLHNADLITFTYSSGRMERKGDKELLGLMQSLLARKFLKRLEMLSIHLGKVENQPELVLQKPAAAIFLTFWLCSNITVLL